MRAIAIVATLLLAVPTVANAARFREMEKFRKETVGKLLDANIPARGYNNGLLRKGPNPHASVTIKVGEKNFAKAARLLNRQPGEKTILSGVRRGVHYVLVGLPAEGEGESLAQPLQGRLKDLLIAHNAKPRENLRWLGIQAHKQGKTIAEAFGR
jgi:hypothetical protein